MSTQRITDSLAALFDSHVIVFWHDAEGEFSSAIDNFSLDNVNIICLHETPELQGLKTQGLISSAQSTV